VGVYRLGQRCSRLRSVAQRNRIAPDRRPISCETNRNVGVRSVVRRGPRIRGAVGRAPSSRNGATLDPAEAPAHAARHVRLTATSRLIDP
jgi:hypothetical protein